MTAALETSRYTPPDPPAGRVTTRCLRPVNRLGYLVDCGMPIDPDADWDEVYCPGDLLAVDGGGDVYDEYTAIREDKRESA